MDLNLGYKILNDLIDIDMAQFFSYANISNVRSHNLKLFVPIANSEVIKSYFIFRFPKIWNSLPSNIIDSPNLKSFNKHLNNFDFSNFLRGQGVR
ncbi:MAG: hypothetical protein MJA29_11820 [Candidatus Omnitrophica bacterium]|nr:hypothetical protein [Candidatus Omnitrophota bacterium]